MVPDFVRELRALAMGKRQREDHGEAQAFVYPSRQAMQAKNIIGFSFRSIDSGIVARAQSRLENCLNNRRHPPFAVVEKLEDGAFLRWHKKVGYLAGYNWLHRYLSDLNDRSGQSNRWKVVPHFEWPEASRRDGEAAGDAVASRPGGALPSSAASCPDVASGSEEASRPGSAVKSPAALLLQGCDAVLLQRGALYDVHSEIGEGTFGCVFAGRLKGASGHEVAVKRLLKPSGMRLAHYRAEAQNEAYLLDRCQNHPYIVQLFDVFACDEGQGQVLIHLVLEKWGEDLGKVMRAMPEDGGFEPSEVRCIVRHVASGVAYLHNVLGFAHGDLKPANILVKRVASGLACKVCDLGCALQGDPALRILANREEISQNGLPVMTLNVRAPEVLFGDARFSYPIDAWSLGVVTALVAGYAFTMLARNEVDYRLALFKQLGVPCEEAELTKLPLWPQKPPRMQAKPWPDAVVSRLGELGLCCLQSLLTWAPSRRLKVAEVTAQGWFADTEASRRAFGAEGPSSQPAPASTATATAAGAVASGPRESCT